MFNLRIVTDIQSRQDMEIRFESQIEGVLAATEKLVSYNLHITTTGASDVIPAKLF